MVPSIDSLLNLLSLEKVHYRVDEWKWAPPFDPIDFSDYDDKTLTYVYRDNDNSSHETRSFDDNLRDKVNELQKHILVEVNQLFSDPQQRKDEAEKVVKSVVVILKFRCSLLKKSGLPIPTTIDNLESLINQFDRRGKKGKKFPGYKIEHDKIRDSAVFLHTIFSWLEVEGCLEENSKDCFISFFQANWNGKCKIMWLGTPKQFVQFWSAFFNPIEKGLKLSRVGVNQEKLLSCFIVTDPDTKQPFKPGALKNSHVKVDWYNDLIAIIHDSIEQTL